MNNVRGCVPVLHRYCGIYVLVKKDLKFHTVDRKPALIRVIYQVSKNCPVFEELQYSTLAPIHPALPVLILGKLKI